MKKILALLSSLVVLLTISGCSCDHKWADATCTTPSICEKCGEEVGRPLGHRWQDATCTTPKVCKICDMTEGEAAGHSWVDATCQAPKTCQICKMTEGEIANHSWKDATCQNPKTCMTCHVTEGTQISHVYVDGKCVTCDYRQLDVGKWRSISVQDDRLVIVDIDLDNLFIFLTEYHRIDMLDVDTVAKLVQYDATVVSYDGVEYIDCVGDGVNITYNVSGDTVRISYESGVGGDLTLERIDAQQIKVIEVTGSTFFANNDCVFTYQSELSVTDLSIIEPTTTTSSEQETVEPLIPPSTIQPTTCSHSWNKATCTDAKICKLCGAVEGEANGHNWQDATCTSPQHCTVCGETVGLTTTHNYSNGKCVECGSRDPNYVQETMVWIPTHGGTKYHRKSNCSQMKDPVQVTKSEAINRGFEPCGKCY